MGPWLLVIVQVLVFATFPFVFAVCRPQRRLALFTVYIAAVLTLAGTLGAVYSLPLLGDLVVSFGGIAYGALILCTILLYIVSRDLEVVRITIQLVVVLNLLIAIVLATTARALRTPTAIDPFQTAPELFEAPIWATVIGGTLNVAQLVLLIVVFEALTRRVRRPGLLGPAYVATFIGVLAIDGLLFPTLLTLVEPDLLDLLGAGIDGVLAKLLLGLLYAVPLVVFLVVHRDHLAASPTAPFELRHAFLRPRAQLTRELDRQQEALDRQTSLLALAGRVARVGGWAVDLPSRELYCSHQVFDILEVSPDWQPTLEQALAAWPERWRDEIRAAYAACETAGTPFEFEAQLPTGTGRHIWVRALGEAERDADGRIRRVVGALLDITGSRQDAARTEELARRLTSTMESITDAIATIDRDWRLTYLNPRAEELLGAPRREVLGRRLGDAYPAGIDSAFDHAARRVMAENVPATSLDWYAPGRFWIEANIYPSDDGLTAAFRDVTERVERERSLRHIADREQQAADKLRHLDQVKNSFLTAVSHELRTPLTVVQGMASTLQRLRGQQDPALRARIEDALAENAERLSDLLTDLLDIDRLSRGVLTADPVPFDLVAATRRIVATSPVASRTHLEVPDTLEVVADPLRCERILANLLDNAGKYAPTGIVTVRLTRQADRGVRIEVLDEGPGIPEDERAAIFEPFHRIEHDHPKPGTGVGLALVAEFAAIHGGRAWAAAHRDGAHLIVELPGESLTPDPRA